jgi:hypothetical protein
VSTTIIRRLSAGLETTPCLAIPRNARLGQRAADPSRIFFDDWFDPIESGLRDRVREFIRAMIESELDEALSRPRYGLHPQEIPSGEMEQL